MPFSPGGPPHVPGSISSGQQRAPRYVVSGQTLDASGAALPNCMVEIYESVSNSFRGATTSDANGNYTYDVDGPESGLTFQATAYLVGSPDVAGVTVNTLVGTWA